MSITPHVPHSPCRLCAGAAQVDITPKLPIRLCGQYYQRIADHIFSPLTANILAIEGTGAASAASAVFVSCDLLAVSREFTAAVRRKLAALSDSAAIPDPACVMLSAIHTHTAPYLANNAMSVFWGDDFAISPDPAAETLPADYADEISDKIARGILTAWQNRRPVSLAAGFDHICISYNRRTCYTDGHTEMYGSTARPDFAGMEDGQDCGIHFILLRSQDGNPVSAIIEAACPAQVMEHKQMICADFWSVVRQKLSVSLGSFPLIALCGAAGDLSPRDLVRTAMDEAAMHATEMYNPAGMEQVASRIAEAFLRFANTAEIEPDAGLRHTMREFALPLRKVSVEEAAQASVKYDALRAKHLHIEEFTEAECTQLSLFAATRNRLIRQQQIQTHPVEVHALRLGSVSILTNPFELYLNYADRMRAASGNPNTMIVQLTNGYEGYLPTARAVAGGGYSAGINNGFLGPEGGNELVARSLDLLHSL